MSPEPDGGMAHIGWRMEELEKRVERMGEQIESRLSGLSAKIDQLGFVRSDVYLAERKADERERAADRARVDEVDKRAMWAIGLVCAVTIGAIITAILSTAGVFA